MDNPILWLWKKLHQPVYDSKAWNENEHPRNDKGQFTDGQTGGNKPKRKTDTKQLLGIKAANNITIKNTSFHFKKRLHERYNSLKLELPNGDTLEGTDSVAYVLQHPDHIKHDKENKKIKYYRGKILCVVGDDGTLITTYKRKRGFKF